MFSGPRLGEALTQAMRAKGVTQACLAKEFGVTQPSVSDWIKHGRIHKKHVLRLVQFFAPDFGPDHWGLEESAVDLLATSPEARRLLLIFQALPSEGRAAVLAVAEALQEYCKGKKKAAIS